jgi:exosortase C (VPDSG-CTERM-specific)
MQTPDESSAALVPKKNSGSPQFRPQLSPRFGLSVLVLIACFGRPLYNLAELALHSELFSHIILIPFISAYLIWIKRAEFVPGSAPARKIAAALLGLGLVFLTSYWIAILNGIAFAPEDALALQILSFVLLLVGLCSWFLDRTTLRAISFPLGFLVFMVPFPLFVTLGIETFLQHASAAAANVFFSLAGTTVFHHDLIFQLPGITLQVAPECSGIRSSLALFITSLIAGHLFLRTPWKCAVLTFAVIPLAILRNGFRIFTLGELCVRISPDMIDSPIHHRGGPVFFALSLIPLFFLLRTFYKSDHRGKLPNPPAP